MSNNLHPAFNSSLRDKVLFSVNGIEFDPPPVVYGVEYTLGKITLTFTWDGGERLYDISFSPKDALIKVS